LELLPLNIPLGGIQYQKGGTRSTVLHGANWGGHIEMVAIILQYSPPEKNEVVSKNEKKGWYPSNEINAKFDSDKKNTLKELWKSYKEQGSIGVKKYIPQTILVRLLSLVISSDNEKHAVM